MKSFQRIPFIPNFQNADEPFPGCALTASYRDITGANIVGVRSYLISNPPFGECGNDGGIIIVYDHMVDPVKKLVNWHVRNILVSTEYGYDYGYVSVSGRPDDMLVPDLTKAYLTFGSYVVKLELNDLNLPRVVAVFNLFTDIPVVATLNFGGMKNGKVVVGVIGQNRCSGTKGQWYTINESLSPSRVPLVILGGLLLPDFNVNGEYLRVQMSPDSSRVYVSNSCTGKIYTYFLINPLQYKEICASSSNLEHVTQVRKTDNDELVWYLEYSVDGYSSICTYNYE